MAYDSAAIEAALRDLLKQSIPILERAGAQAELQSSEPRVDAFGRDRIKAMLMDSWGRIEKLSEYGSAVNAVQGWPVVGDLLGKPITDGLSSLAHDSQDFLRRFLGDMLWEAKELEVRPASVKQWVSKIADDAARDEVEHVGVHFIAMLNIEELPIELDERFKIVKSQAVLREYPLIEARLDDDSYAELPAAAIVGRYVRPKRITERHVVDLTGLEDWEKFEREMGEILALIRTLAPGDCFVWRRVSLSLDWWLAESISWSTAQAETWAHEDSNVSKSDARDLRELWRARNGLGESARRSFDIILQRVNDAQERGRVEDQLIDLAIAAEALLLRGEATESAHKFATRAAWLLGENPENRLRILKLFKAVYAARSKIVHGDVPKIPAAFENIYQMKAQFEQEIRKAIVRVLEKRGKIDWDVLTTGGGRVNSLRGPARAGLRDYRPQEFLNARSETVENGPALLVARQETPFMKTLER